MTKMSSHTASSLLAALAGILILLRATTCNFDIEEASPEAEGEQEGTPSLTLPVPNTEGNPEKGGAAPHSAPEKEPLRKANKPHKQGPTVIKPDPGKGTEGGNPGKGTEGGNPGKGTEEGNPGEEKRGAGLTALKEEGGDATPPSAPEKEPLRKANTPPKQVPTVIKCAPGEDLEIPGGIKMRIIETGSNRKKKTAKKGEIFRVQFIAPAGKKVQYTVTIGADSFTLQALKTQPATKIIERQIDSKTTDDRVTVSCEVTMQTRGETKDFDCQMSIGVEQ